ncbi:kinesin-like protein KIF6 [Branchiostoma lanceolatum]|uniref:kinesin-like protein KIF6 n=1 Tax=Branchiostoma lanceolatum TaxID=7740 RepID=UPI003455C21A
MVKQTIKIFCRVKPTKGKTGLYEVDEEESGGPKLSFFVPKDQTQIVNNTKEEYNFRFQRVFEQQTKQEEVFEHVAQPVIDNAISGYNGTIFAYGQTGSGKTFTITGGAERYTDRGIIPRTLSYLFEYYEKHPDFTYTTHVSYLEIYNENGYDLLDPKHEAAKLEDLPKVSLMEDTDQNIHLKNLSVHQAMNEEEALNLLFLGDTNRMIAETPMNQASTRSHCIFTIHLTAREPGSATIRRSKLHLVDLAGSERVGKTGVVGTLLAEAKYINLSLHYLEQVIVALSEKSRSHIPYRNSMMTSVLRDSLGGNCMTTMIATCSVEKKNVDESISTCRFAQRVALIKNDALLNEEVDPKLMVLRLKKEIAELKDQLSLATGEQPTDELSGEDADRLHQMVRGYVEDTDPDASLPVGADMRKINECFRIFKRLVLERHPGKLGGVSNGGGEEDEEPSVSEDSGLGSAPSTAGSAEVKKLKDLLQQRDNEINILVNMLKKEKKRAQDAALILEERGIPFSAGEGPQPNGPGRPPSSRSKHRNREERSRESMSMSKSVSQPDSREKETTPPYSQSTTVRLRKIGGEMSVGRQEAFEIFKRDYEHSITVDDQKGLLKQRYAEAKQLGEKVNSSRVQINHVKSLIQQHRMARAAQGVSEDVGFSEEPDEEEQHLRQQMEDEKASYKVTFNRLRVLKTEIEHLQHLLEKARLQMQKDFELWWAEQTVNAHAPKPPQEPPAAWKTPPISPINAPHHHPPSRKMAANFSMHPPQDPGPAHAPQGGSSRRHGSLTDDPTADAEPIRASHSYHGNLDAVGLGHHGDRRMSSHSDSSGSHGRVPRHREVLEDSRSAAPAIPLTGDARADADIMAFFKARQKILQQQGKR